MFLKDFNLMRFPFLSYLRYFTLLLFSCLSFTSFGQGIPITPAAKVSVLTVDTGVASHELYGHTGIRITDYAAGLDIVYNYGFFDFETTNFVAKFVKGDLQYFVATHSYAQFEYSYKIDQRSIYEQVLDISFEEKQDLYKKLNASLFNDDKFYTYKFIDRNCTTKVIDKLNEVLENAPITNKSKPQTYRAILNDDYLQHDYFTQLGIHLIFGTKVDQPATTLFLPLELKDALNKTTYKGKPIVLESSTLFQASKEIPKFDFTNSIYLIICFLSLVIIVNNKTITSIYLVIAGFIGIFLIAVGFYSFHQEVHWNYNAVLFNPLFFVLMYYMWKNNSKKIIVWSVILIAFQIIYTLYLLNKVSLFVVYPFIVAHILLCLRLFLKHKTIV